MKNEIVKFTFNETEVEFEPSSKNNVMVNATQMGKIFGKLPKDFLKNDDTQAFISECLKKENSPFLSVENYEDLISSKQKSGTWMHRVLALKFAAWLNPAFELWIYLTIDKLLYQYANELKDAASDKLKYERLLEEKKQKLLLNNPEFAEYIELTNLVNDSEKRRKKAITDQMRQIRIDFTDTEPDQE